MPEETRRISALIEDATSREMISLALRIHSGLVRKTPVDTGWARANWLPSVGTPIEETTGSPEDIDTSASAAGALQVAAYRGFDQGPIYVANNVPYIGRLNAGSSGQAPAGFIEGVVRSELRRSNGKILS